MYTVGGSDNKSYIVTKYAFTTILKTVTDRHTKTGHK